MFLNTPRSTVCNWLKALKIESVVCTPDERSVFRTANPTLCGAFGLVSHTDLAKLIEYRSNRSKRTSALHISSSSIASSPQISTCSSTCNVESDTEKNDGNVLQNIVTYSDSDEDEQGQSDIIIQHKSPEKCNNESFVNTRVDLLVTDSPLKTKRSRTVLSPEEIPESLKVEIQSLKEFCTKPLNPLACGRSMSNGTANKLIERLLSFMFFCSKVKNKSDLSLSLFNDSELFTSFIEYLRDVRKLKPSTIANFLGVAISVVKYNVVTNDATADPENAPQIRAYRSFQRRFLQDAYQLSKREKEGFSKKSSQQFYFAHVLETLRNLRDKYLECGGGVKKFRHLHDFVLLALYLRAMPGRSKELRTLQLHDEAAKGHQFDYGSFERGNFVIFDLEQRVLIVQSEFKTSKTTGPIKLDISDDNELTYYLRLYVQARHTLMLGNSHDYFFCNKYGHPFACSSAIAKYLQDIFEREVSIRASTTAMRHAIVTYFNSIDESKDVNLRKSLAALMKHSVRYQETVYCDQTHDEKTKAGRSLMRDSLAADVFGERDDIADMSAESSDGNSSDDELELVPQAGDIVALLDPAATKTDISFFIAKVARYTKDRREAHLIHLGQVEGSDNLYVLKPGRVWTESLKALIFPIDIVYDSSKKAYELRTTPDCLYKYVHG